MAVELSRWTKRAVIIAVAGLAALWGMPHAGPVSLQAQSGPSINAATFHYDAQRTGWNPNETALTPGAVAGPNFGMQWNSSPLDSVTIGSTTYPPHLYATPLYVDTVQITAGAYAGQAFSVVFAATSNNYVYAVNAFDVPGVAAGTILWSTSLGLPGKLDLDGGVAIGILATPVIDVNAATMYVAGDVVTSPQPLQHNWQVFALDLGSGSTLPGWPLTINNVTLNPTPPINQNGPARFEATQSMSQRGALNLSPDGGLLYVPFGGYNDGAAGWMVAVSTDPPALVGAFSGGPSQGVVNGGMWGSGGPALDLLGNLYDTTGNSPNNSQNAPGVWGESLLVWQPFTLSLNGTYTPWNYCQMDAADADLGGSTPAVIPDLDPSTTSTPHLVAFGSKQGNIYLVDRDNLPGALTGRPPCSNDPSSDPSLIAPDPRPYYGGLPGPLNVFGPYSETCAMSDNARMRTTPAYFQDGNGNSFLFVSGATKRSECDRTPVPPGLARVAIVTSPGQPAYPSIDATDSLLSLYSPGPPVVTSNGSTGGVVWLMDANVYRSASLVGPNVPHPVLYAFDASTMQLLWKSTADQLNVGGKYSHAVVARGVVFVGTDRIQAFGIKSCPNIVFKTLNASLDTGTLAGTAFPVSFSYDACQVAPVGQSFITLSSFDFTLLGVPFTRNDIFQGGQVIFQDGILQDVTASFQVILPPNSPVNNITFGFGGPGVIGYIDLAGQFGGGSFTVSDP
jgi:hypothetical protein